MIAAYSLNEKYVMNANFRNDWSNTFGQNVNRRFNPAFSVGVSWKMGFQLYTCRRILRPGKATHARRISCVCRLPDTGYRRRPYAPRQLQELVGAFPFCSHTYIPGLYTVPDETANPILLNDPTGTTSIDRYTLWARSDARIASMSTFRCRSINVTWSVYTNNTAGIAGSLLKKMHVRNMDITATVNNVFLIADPKWHGMDPDLGGDRKAPRSYTMGLNFGL